MLREGERGWRREVALDPIWEKKEFETSVFWQTGQGKMLENGEESKLSSAPEKMGAIIFSKRNRCARS